MTYRIVIRSGCRVEAFGISDNFKPAVAKRYLPKLSLAAMTVVKEALLEIQLVWEER